MKKQLTSVEKGNIGEKYTVRFLRRRQFRIIDRNMRNKYSEIDIIAENREYIIFVEVKTRTEDSIVRGVDAVDFRKQQKLLQAAHYYLNYTRKSTKQPRFDIAEVTLNEKNKPCSINYIPNAFSQEGTYASF